MSLLPGEDDVELAPDFVHRGQRGGGRRERVRRRLGAASADDTGGFSCGEVQSVSVRTCRLVVAQGRSVDAGHGERAWLEELARDRQRGFAPRR